MSTIPSAEDAARRFAQLAQVGDWFANDLAKFLTERDALVRNAAIEDVAKWHEVQASSCVERATNHHPAGAVYARIMEAANEHLARAKAIRSLKSSPPQAEGADTP